MNTKVRIDVGWLLLPAGEKYQKAIEDNIGDKLKDYSGDELLEIAEKLRKEWGEVEESVLGNLCNILDLEFKQELIDCFLVPYFIPQSFPLVISPQGRDELDTCLVLTHELTHILLTDNKKYSQWDREDLSNMDLGEHWKKCFTGIDEGLFELPVYAVLWELWVVRQNRRDLWEADKRDLEFYEAQGHLDAMQYIEEHDNSETLEKIKAFYKN